MELSNAFKKQIFQALLKKRENFSGLQEQFAKQHDINPQVFSDLKRITNSAKPDYKGKLKDSQWLQLGRELDVQKGEQKWRFANTDVHKFIKDKVEFAKEYSCALVMVDEPEIGKTESGKYLARTMKNCFYIDCSQCKGKTQFIKTLASAVGVETRGRLADIKADTKYYLSILENPIIILDEMGDLSYNAFLDIKEYYNALQDQCGWFAMGSDGLKKMIERGIDIKKVGFREVYSRFGSNYIAVVPRGEQQKERFYTRLLGQILSINLENKEQQQWIIRRCLQKGKDKDKQLSTEKKKELGGIRRAKYFVNIIRQEQQTIKRA